jgi:predicted regulator of Ras-like GTPase activity (Roadblock/LC7/MglB family)
MKPLPEGKSLGWMQAPASWIDSHTVRFIGVVRVVIQDGEGFILIKKGKPLFYYFKQGTIELKGHTALDYFNSHPVIEFNLCKYTPDELAWAMKLCNIEDPDRVVPKKAVVTGPVYREHTPLSPPADPPVAKPAGEKRIPDPVVVSPPVPTVDKRAAVSGPVYREHTPLSRPANPPVAKPAGDIRIPDPVVVSPPVLTVEQRAAVSGPVSGEHTPLSRTAAPPVAKPAGDTRIPDPVVVSPPVLTVEQRAAVSGPVSGEHNLSSRTAAPPVAKPAGDTRIPDPVMVSPPVPKVDKRAVVPQPVAGDDPEVTILSHIRDLDGIVAIAVFNDIRNVIMIGDADSEVLVKIARTMLETAKKITPLLTWGPFVHMTIQIPAGNMIIAPYYDNYLCLLTTRTINIGHIRRILRDLQQKAAPQRVS